MKFSKRIAHYFLKFQLFYENIKSEKIKLLLYLYEISKIKIKPKQKNIIKFLAYMMHLPRGVEIVSSSTFSFEINPIIH